MTESVLFEIKLKILLQKRFCGSHTIPISDLLYSDTYGSAKSARYIQVSTM